MYYNHDCSYLEIGVEYPSSCFDRIHCKKKTSVDPNRIRPDIHIDYLMTSDKFFENLENKKTEFSPDHKWDIIFIDGLHLADQTYRDIKNSVNYCKGFVVLHDCAPLDFKSAHSDYDYFKENNRDFWNGTVWKAFYKFRTETYLKTYTVDVDCGIGVIEIKNKGVPIEFNNVWFEYGKLKKNMDHDLGMISPIEFIKMHSLEDM